MERVGAESCLFAPPLGCKRLPPEPGTQDPAGHRDEACFGAPADAAPVSAVGAVIGAASPISPPTGLTCTDAPPSRPHRPNALRVLQDLNVHSVAEWLGGHATAPHPAHREHDEVGPSLLVELQQQQVARDRDLEVLQGQLDQERERHSAFVQARWFEISSLEDQLVTSQEETLQQAVQRDVLLKTNIALEERGRGLEEQLQQMAPSRKHTEELEERCAHLERQVSSMEAEHALAVKLLRSDLCDADAAARRAERVCQEENSKSRQLEATVEKIDVTLSQVEADVRNGLKERDRLQGQATLFKERLESIQDALAKDTLAEADKNVEDTKEHVEQELIRLKDMCLNQEKSFGTVLAARSARITELEDQLAQATQRVCRVEEDAESMKDGGNIDDTVAALQDRIKEHERNSREMDAEIAGLVVRNTLLRLSRVLCARKARALV
jgi:DNA repair exonuclease SbcCD ATPase subunit